jgi:hypothetical protein
MAKLRHCREHQPPTNFPHDPLSLHAETQKVPSQMRLSNYLRSQILKQVALDDSRKNFRNSDV